MNEIEISAIKASVLMVTYNHEEYIEQAVESVLMQETDFKYELVIGEDCSTDSTREIVLELQNRYPAIIRLLPSEGNMGPNPNFVRTLRACRGQYVAILEGDDYWISPKKLQLQVDFLDRHRECSFCFTNAYIMSADGQTILGEAARPGQKRNSTIEDIVEINFVVNCTTVFRRGLIPRFPGWYTSVQAGDWAHHVLNAEHGDIGYIDEKTTAYRKHSRGISSSLEFAREIQLRLVDAEVINSHLDYRYERIISKEQSRRWRKLATELIKNGYELGFYQVHVKHVSQLFDAWPPDLPLEKKWKRKVLGRIYERLLFQRYNDGGYADARYCWLALVRFQPTLLANRGVWVIGTELLIGTKLTQILHRSFGRVIR